MNWHKMFTNYDISFVWTLWKDFFLSFRNDNNTSCYLLEWVKVLLNLVGRSIVWSTPVHTIEKVCWCCLLVFLYLPRFEQVMLTNEDLCASVSMTGNMGYFLQNKVELKQCFNCRKKIVYPLRNWTAFPSLRRFYRT